MDMRIAHSQLWWVSCSFHIEMLKTQPLVVWSCSCWFQTWDGYPNRNRRSLFQHLNFQKSHSQPDSMANCRVNWDYNQLWSENGVFCAFWLQNVLRPTTACNFSSLIWPAGSAPAALASLLFDPPEPQIFGKTQCFATFLPFRASASSFFLLFLFYSSFF